MDETTARTGRPSPAFGMVLLLMAGLLAYLGSAGLEQGLRAARGGGTPGVFTAASLTCVQHPGHESCTCHGSFTAEDGDEPRGVSLHAAGHDTCVEGAEVAAVDAGAANRVYGPDGSREWVVSVLLLAAALALVVGVAAVWTRYLLAVAPRTQARPICRAPTQPGRSARPAGPTEPERLALRTHGTREVRGSRRVPETWEARAAGAMRS